MPLYEYQCEACGSVFEKMRKFSDEPLTVHENCGGHLHRLMTAPSFQFKGSGWYITDYGRGGKKLDPNGGTKPASEEKKSASDSKGETSSAGSSDKSGSSDSGSTASKSDSSSSSSSTTPSTTTKSPDK